MSRSVQMVLLCEDQQHEAFARRFLRKAGWSTRRLRVEKAPRGRGSAEQFVRERFPTELSGYRSNRHRVTQGIIVMLDGDDKGVDARLVELSRACQAQKLEPRARTMTVWRSSFQLETSRHGWHIWMDKPSTKQTSIPPLNGNGIAGNTLIAFTKCAKEAS